MNEETKGSSVIGGQNCDGTWQQDDIISVCGAGGGVGMDILLISLMRSFLRACVLLFFHVSLRVYTWPSWPPSPTLSSECFKLWSFNEDFPSREIIDSRNMEIAQKRSVAIWVFESSLVFEPLAADPSVTASMFIHSVVCFSSVIKNCEQSYQKKNTTI